MALIQVACPRCQHKGFTGADRVPAVLRCADCGFACWVRDGGRPVHSKITDQLNAAAPRKPAAPRQLKLVRGKSVLTPRTPAPEAA
jgi:hypothetical protein